MKLAEIIKETADELAFPETNRDAVMRCAHELFARAGLQRNESYDRRDFDNVKTASGAKILFPVLEADSGMLRFGYAVERSEPGGQLSLAVNVYLHNDNLEVFELKTVYEPSLD